jgi:sugar (pentulose or hexulose) kinase
VGKCYLGIDFGTGGARVIAISPTDEIEAFEHVEFGDPSEASRAAVWHDALFEVITKLPSGIRKQAAALAVDGTSGTVLACDADLLPAYPPLLYNDARATEEAAAIARAVGASHPAATATSGLAKTLWLKKHLGIERARIFLNQADWLTSLLGSALPRTDYHNALKMGFDIVTKDWPAWVEYLADIDFLPQVVAPGADLGWISPPRARLLGLNSDCLLHAGTTDSIAAFLAAGVRQPGEAVTSLGTTLVLKALSETRVDAAEYGVYSHWFGDLWLVGGASNTGGGALKQFFDSQQLSTLSSAIKPEWESPLDYYPLPCSGERFPINDPAMQPRLTPRPDDDVAFLHGLLESLARIEKQGYDLLESLGATPVSSVLTAGGGAQNAAWSAIRQRVLGTSVSPAPHTEAAYGAALLAAKGTKLLSFAT